MNPNAFHLRRRIVRFKPSRFFADRSGATAVEFALVSVPFLLLVGAIFQICLINWVGQTLDESLQRSARILYTGKYQNANKALSSPTALIQGLKDNMCGSTAAANISVFNCSDLKIDISTANSFASGNIIPALDEETGAWAANFGTRYKCAKPSEIVVITAALKFFVGFSFLNVGFQTFSDGSRLIISTVVLRTEDYDISTGSPCS